MAALLPVRWALVLLCSLLLAPPAFLRAAEGTSSAKKPSAKKPSKSKDAVEPPEIKLPQDAEQVVLTYDPGAGGFVRKGEAPYLKIQADGSLTVTNLHDGVQTKGKLTEDELQDLLKFVVQEQKFLQLTGEKIDADVKKASAKGPFIAVGGAGTSEIELNLDETLHKVRYRAASAYLQAYPKAKMLAQYAAIEKRLSELALKVSKAK